MLNSTQRRHDRLKWWSIHDMDKYVCPDCKRTSSHDEFQRWEIHHIDGIEGNCVALCNKCHQIRHGASRSKISVEWWKESMLSLGEHK